MKRILICLCSGIVLTLAGMFINYRYSLKYSRMWLAFRMYGGEITSERGFGLRMVRIYSMTPGQTGSIRYSFDLFTFVLSVLVLSALVYCVIFLLRRLKGR